MKGKICPLSLARPSGPNNHAVPVRCQADSCMFWDFDKGCLIRNLLISKV